MAEFKKIKEKIQRLATRKFYSSIWQEIRRRFFYNYYKLKNASYSEIIFLDFRIIFIIVIILAINLLLFYPQPIVLTFPTLENQRAIIDSLMRTISILFGIVFSFVILSFNIFNKHFGRFAFVEFFKSKIIRRLFTLLTGTICILIYSYSYLKEIAEIDNYGKGLYILSICFCIASFFFLFPSAIKLLKKSQSRNNIKEIVQRFNKTMDFEHFEVKYLNKSHDIYYKDPILLLREIGIAAIKEYDIITLSLIITECLNYFKNCTKIEDDNTRKEKLTIYNDITALYLQLFRIAIKEKNSDVAITICRVRFELEEFVLKNLEQIKMTDHDEKYKFLDLNFDLDRYFDRAIQFNEDDVCKELIEEYRDFILTAIPILIPKGFEFKSLRSSQEADAITSSFINEFGSLGKQITQNKKTRLYKELANAFYTVALKISKSDFGSSGKNYLLKVLGNVEFNSIKLYIESPEVKGLINLEIPFTHNDILFKNGADQYRFLLLIQVLNILFHFEKLNNLYLNHFKAEIMALLRDVMSTIEIKSAALQGIKTLGKFSKLITASDNDYRKEIYIKCEEYLQTLKHYCLENGIKDEDIGKALSDSIAVFTERDEFKRHLLAKGYVFDDNII